MKLPENTDQIFQYFEERTNLEKKPSGKNFIREYRLDRMKALCNVLGNPQDKIPAVHIAGSKGKGSTGAYIGAMLSETGEKVGIYSSPHLLDYRERFRILLPGENPPGIFPEDTALETGRFLLKKVQQAETDGLPPNGEKATTFELLTLFAFLLFNNSGCTYMVLETGLGGRLDATNVLIRPEAAVITPVEKEHTEILGKYLYRIAYEKAGIFREENLIISAAQHPVVRLALDRSARNKKNRVIYLNKEVTKIAQLPLDRKGDQIIFPWLLTYNGKTEKICLKMGGLIQAQNAALALITAVKLKGREKTPAFIRAAEKTALPGRFQILSLNPLIVIDSAHTASSVKAAKEAFFNIISRLFPATNNKNKAVLVFGSVLGKNHKKMSEVLCSRNNGKGVFSEILITTPGFFKPSNPEEVARVFSKKCKKTSLLARPEEAFGRALEISLQNSLPVLVAGSFFTASLAAEYYKRRL